MTPFDYLLYGITLFGWSTSFFAITFQLGVVEPEVSVFWRFLIASMLMFGVTRLAKMPLTLPIKQHWRPAALGLLLFSLNFSLFYHGGLGVSSGLLAVAFALASAMIMLLDSVFNRQIPKITHLAAAVIGFIGVGMLYAPEISWQNGAMMSLILCLFGTLSFSLGNIVSSASQKAKIPVMTTNCWGMVYGTVYLFIWNATQGHAFIIEPTFAYIFSLAWLVSVATVATFTCYLMLVGRIGAGRAGYLTVLFPVLALILSSFFEGYNWTLLGFMGLVLVMVGNWLILKR